MGVPSRYVARVGRSFPGQGPETNPGTMNARTLRNVRRGRDPRIAERGTTHNDLDPTATALKMAAPFRYPSDAGPRPAGATAATDPTLAGGHLPKGCACGSH